MIPLTSGGGPLPEGVSSAVRTLKTVAVFVLAATATPLAVAHFTTNVPRVVPSVAGWERITGDLQFKKPRVNVAYEFYVNPARPAIYEVVRYRVTNLVPAAPGEVSYATTEKLQWDRDGRDLRRFECVAAEGEGDCAWREMEKGGPDYVREVPVLLWLYGEHNKASRR